MNTWGICKRIDKTNVNVEEILMEERKAEWLKKIERRKRGGEEMSKESCAKCETNEIV